MYNIPNGQIHLKNLVANATRFSKCVWPFWDIIHKIKIFHTCKKFETAKKCSKYKSDRLHRCFMVTVEAFKNSKKVTNSNKLFNSLASTHQAHQFVFHLHHPE